MQKDEEVGEEIVSLMSEATPANGSTTVNRRRRRPMEQVRLREDESPPSSLMLRLTCLSVLTLVVLGSMGLLTYFQDESAPKYQFIPFEGDEDVILDPVPGDHSVLGDVDKDTFEKLLDEVNVVKSKRPPHTVRYSPQWNQNNPFDFQGTGPNPLAPLLSTSQDDTSSLGYLTLPHLVKNQLVFCSQGDVFITSLQPSGPLPATKLTTTVGNVLDPRLHPNLRYLAYTATYSKRRDIYLLDLQGGSPAVRLTYWDTAAGVDGLIGWWGESSLVFRALSNEVSLPDYRLYVLHLDDGGSFNQTNHRIEQVDDLKIVPDPQDTSSRTMLQIDSIPLSQARDAARYENCWYFVRYSQSSHTIRYVGGTAEQLYRYCDGDTHTDRLFFRDRYNGTSKAPQLYPNSNTIFFLSDRARRPDGSWRPDRMNVWAMPLSENIQDHSREQFIQITDTSCDFEGRVIQEYSIDPETGHMVVRIGADLYMMSMEAIQAKLQRRYLSVDENMTQIEDSDDDNDDDESPSNETITKVYYKYNTPVLESRFAEDQRDHVTGSATELTRLPIVVHSDFHTHHERLIPVNLLLHMTSADIYSTAFGSLQFVMTLRGQLWVAPIEEDTMDVYKGAGRNMPGRRYRVAPGATMGGMVRILTVRHVPNPVEDDSSDKRLAVILATDPLTDTAEHAFYLIETQSSATPLFLDRDHLPKPFLGGHVSGGSTKDGGLGSVQADSVTISPCGRRMAWTDRDGRILVMNLPLYQDMTTRDFADCVVLPQENESGQPMVGEEVQMTWSPGGRYLAVQHNARNQFTIISIVDLGDPEGKDKVADIRVERIVQATPDRFNSDSAYWGKSTADMHTFDRDDTMASLLGTEPPDDVATTLYFLSDRDINSDVRSPWGTREPMPHFKKLKSLFALPLNPKNSTTSSEGPFSGGGASELKVDAMLARKKSLMAMKKATSKRRKLLQRSLAGAFGLADDVFTEHHINDITRRVEDKLIEGADDGGKDSPVDETLRIASFPCDMDIDFGPIKDRSFIFARNAYRLATIPEANYVDLVSQTPDDGSFVLITVEDDKALLVVYLADDFPSDQYTAKAFSPIGRNLFSYGRSTRRDYLYFGFTPDGYFRVVPNTGSGISKMLMDTELDNNIVSAFGLHLSVWPSLEYRHLYDDAWRMLRDYFYDPEMTGIDWPTIHERYLPLVSRCAKREELDDVLIQMASELSALHVFVYGGEYNSPLDGSLALAAANDVASLGATLKRMPEWKGYQITSIAESDPDFSLIDGRTEIYSPLSDKTLRLTGQQGLQVGDVIVGINGESVMNVVDIHMLLRGMAGYSVKLDVLRLASRESSDTVVDVEVPTETVIVVPIKTSQADILRYHAWEWKTRQLAEKLAEDNGFSVGYVHLQDMSGPEAENAFARGFFPNYNKDALILDVRHNRGGNIDSWVLDVLQRKAWMYWQSRDFTVDNGGLGWDEQFAFRGHIVVLLDEKTSSDGEGVSRGISELGLGRLIGTRTWGGGIWLASDNHLVDGGIATVRTTKQGVRLFFLSLGF